VVLSPHPGSVLLGCYCAFQLRHTLGQHPRRAIELYVLVDAVNLTGGDVATDTAPPFIDAMLHSVQPALDYIFLNDIQGAPKVRSWGVLIVGPVLTATGGEQLGWRDRS
jgi:hypothetical protein